MAKHEEKCIVFSEKTLNFHLNTCDSIDTMFRKYAYLSELNDAQFAEAARSLQLQTKSLKRSPNIERFYEALRVEKNFRLKDLIVLGTLLSFGEQKQKAKILFHSMDNTRTGVVDSEEVVWLVEQIVDLAVNKLPLLVDETQTMVKGECLDEYVNSIKARTTSATFRLVSNLVEDKESLSLQEFVNKLTSTKLSLLLSPHEVRKFVCSQPARQVPH